MKPTCRILWAGNLLMSDLTFDPSFKVKRWFTSFGELSFRWIQICIGSPMHRSSFISGKQYSIGELLKRIFFFGIPESQKCWLLKPAKDGLCNG